MSRRLFTRFSSRYGRKLVVTSKLNDQKSTNSQYCVNIVQKQDFDNYLCCLLLSPECRSAAFALRAFNVELASIKDVVSKVEIGQMRFQFWRDTLQKIHEPVALELAAAVEKHNLSKRWLTRTLEEREKRLKDLPFQTVEEVEQFAENTSASLLYLTLEALGVRNVNADHVASHIGKAQGLTTLIRATPYHASNRNVLLPVELTLKHNVSQQAIIRGSSDQQVKDVIFELASLANSHLSKARSLQSSVPKEALPAFLVTVPVESYLERIQKEHFNVFSPALQRRDPLLPVALWWKNFRRTY